jgi:hypothetical protein
MNISQTLFHTFLNEKMTSKMEKGLKLMGLSTDQLVDQFLQNERGALPLESWSIFWAGLKQKSKATDVVSKLLNHFILSLQGTIKSSMSYAISALQNTNFIRF